MAKKNEVKSKKTVEKEAASDVGEKKISKFQWFLFVFIIPLAFAIIVALVFFSIMGVNVFDKAKSAASSIPVVSSLVGADKKKPPTEAEQLAFQNDEQKAKIAQLQKELKKKDKEVNTLESKVQTLEQEKASKDAAIQQNDQQNQTQNQMQNQMQNGAAGAQTQNQAGNGTPQTQDPNKGVKDAAKMYQQMSAQKAADILVAMNRDQAVQILKQMRTDGRAQILQKMTPKDAADFTVKLTEAQQQTQP